MRRFLVHINCNIFSFIEYYNLEGQMLDDNFLSLYFDSLVIYQDLGNDDPDLVLGLLCILGIGNNDLFYFICVVYNS